MAHDLCSLLAEQDVTQNVERGRAQPRQEPPGPVCLNLEETDVEVGLALQKGLQS